MITKIVMTICIAVFLFFSTGNGLCAVDTSAFEKENRRLSAELDSMGRIAEKMNKERMALKEENDKLRNERAGVYLEMGIAYTKAGLLDEAIDAYTKSLSYSPNNAKIHYYLGLLYQKSRRNPEKAAFHFKKYLYLNPDAKDKKEVQYLIKMVLNKR